MRGAILGGGALSVHALRFLFLVNLFCVVERALIGRAGLSILLVSRAEVMIDRDSWGC